VTFRRARLGPDGIKDFGYNFRRGLFTIGNDAAYLFQVMVEPYLAPTLHTP
jgi:hypothetical protein